MKYFAILAILLFGNLASAQNPANDPKQFLQAGPMLGYSEMREVMVWVQTNAEANVQIKYWQKNMSSPLFETSTVKTQKANGYTAHLLADEVMPGITYQYKLYINGDFIEFNYPLEFKAAPDWAYKKDPPEFSVAVGSCTYINDQPFDRKGTPYGGQTDIFNKIHDLSPDIMIWLGDNTYYREADWGTKTGMIYRNTHTRQTTDLQPLLASTHNYATWDDHDYGPNDHNRTFINKAVSLDVFKMFWGNQSYGFLDEACATTKFTWGDVDFYLLDNRWFRAANNLNEGDKPYFGTKQIDWLIENLKASNANFKIIGAGGQILNPAAVYENYANYAEERAYFLRRLEEENIEGVLFLSGDRHHTELTEMERTYNYPLRDLTVSPLTSGTHSAKDEGNTLQVEKTLVNEKNFAILDFMGKWGERKMNITVFNEKGKKQWSKEYDLKDFRNAK
jgi:alkaline phosphatase D